MLTVVMFLIFVLGSCQLFKEYHYLLDYKRDERTFNEYRERSREQLEEICEGNDFDF